MKKFRNYEKRKYNNIFNYPKCSWCFICYNYLLIMGHPNTKKHKAKHGGYKKRVTKGYVNGILSLYAGINQTVKEL